MFVSSSYQANLVSIWCIAVVAVCKTVTRQPSINLITQIMASPIYSIFLLVCTFFTVAQQIRLLEQAMLQQDITVPVYFSLYNQRLAGIVSDITRTSRSAGNKKRDSATSELINTISANGYQVVVSGASHAANKQSKIPIIQGELVKPISKASDADAKLPLILVVAHLDTFGLINQHLANYDVSILLSLVDLFSKLNNGISTSPKYRLMFVVSESGSLLNYQGIKKWLDLNIDENALSQVSSLLTSLSKISSLTCSQRD